MLEALAADYLEYLGLPFAGTAVAAGGLLIGALKRQRAVLAREVLLDEMRRGKTFPKDLSEEDAAAMLFRYMRAAEEGAARLNLKLLVAVMAGHSSEQPFYANEFLLWADILASLRPQEVALLGVAHRVARAQDFAPGENRDHTLWEACSQELSARHGIGWDAAETYAASLLRTGLMVIGVGTMSRPVCYIPSRLLERVAEMADFEAHYMEQ